MPLPTASPDFLETLPGLSVSNLLTQLINNAEASERWSQAENRARMRECDARVRALTAEIERRHRLSEHARAHIERVVAAAEGTMGAHPDAFHDAKRLAEEGIDEMTRWCEAVVSAAETLERGARTFLAFYDQDADVRAQAGVRDEPGIPQLREGLAAIEAIGARLDAAEPTPSPGETP